MVPPLSTHAVLCSTQLLVSVCQMYFFSPLGKPSFGATSHIYAEIRGARILNGSFPIEYQKCYFHRPQFLQAFMRNKFPDRVLFFFSSCTIGGEVEEEGLLHKLLYYMLV